MSDELKDYSDGDLNDLIAKVQNRIIAIEKKRIQLSSSIELELDYQNCIKNLKRYKDELASRINIPFKNSGMDEKAPVGTDKGAGEKGGDTTKHVPKKNKLKSLLIISSLIMAGIILSFFFYMQYLDEKKKTTIEPGYPKQLFERKSSLEVPDRKKDPEKEENHETSLDGTIPPPIQLHFKLSGGEKKVEEGAILKVSGNFKRDSGLFYWICFVDEEYIWPQLSIDDSEFSEKEVTVPNRFSEGKEGKLLLISVNNEVNKRFDGWESTNPLFRSLNKIKIIKEINIK